jgi:hypothetical protein
MAAATANLPASHHIPYRHLLAHKYASRLRPWAIFRIFLCRCVHAQPESRHHNIRFHLVCVARPSQRFTVIHYQNPTIEHIKNSCL